MMIEALKNNGGRVNTKSSLVTLQPSLDGGRPDSQWVHIVHIWMFER
jgi:hypothetical protein